MERKGSICYLHNAPEAYTATAQESGLHPDEKGRILWHIVNFTPDQDKHKTIRALEHAYAAWQEAFDLIPPVGRVIFFETTDDILKAHSKHYFLAPKMKEQALTRPDGSVLRFQHKWPFDDMGGVLAHVIPGRPDVFYDEGENWGDILKWEGNVLFASLKNTAIHEIGHTLGLGHSNDKAAIMYPQSTGLESLGLDDRAGLSAFWGDRKLELAAKLKAPTIVKASEEEASAALLLEALKYFGIREVAGTSSHPDIIQWIRSFFPGETDDSGTAWCSIFLNAICKAAGLERSGSASARSWLQIGKAVQWEERKAGDIAIFWREDPSSWKGHVSVYVNDRDLKGSIRCLGGNQNNAVNIATYDKGQLLGLRRLSKV